MSPATAGLRHNHFTRDGSHCAPIPGGVAHLALTITLVRFGVRMWPAIYIQAAVAGTIGTLLVGIVLALVLYRRDHAGDGTARCDNRSYPGTGSS